MRMFLMAAFAVLSANVVAQEFVPRGFSVAMVSNCGGISCAEDAVEEKRTERDTVEYAIVHSVECGSPADKAGLRTGDVILTINGVNLLGVSSDAAWDLVADIGDDTFVALNVLRANGQKPQKLKISFLRAAYMPTPCYRA